MRLAKNTISLRVHNVYGQIYPHKEPQAMSISSSASNKKNLANVANKEGAISNTPVTLSERSITGFALIRIFVGYLWFQQLFWKLPPTFAGLYGYIVRESQHAIIPGYGALLQHTFLAGAAISLPPLAARYSFRWPPSFGPRNSW